jgi:hypothetical protein
MLGFLAWAREFLAFLFPDPDRPALLSSKDRVRNQPQRYVPKSVKVDESHEIRLCSRSWASGSTVEFEKTASPLSPVRWETRK